MAEKSAIEWTDATWNPVTGCAVISPGCANCYAMKLAGGRLQHHPSRAGLTVPSKAGPVWNGLVRFNEAWLDQPLRWTRPRRIFVCAHGDLFAEGVPDAWIDRVFAVMALAPQHTFQVLTKRAARMRAYFEQLAKEARVAGERTDIAPRRIDDAAAELTQTHGDGLDDVAWPLPNVWLGVSAEDQARADERIPELLAAPAFVRFVSAEPLIGPIDFTTLDVNGEAEVDALNPTLWRDEIEQWRGTSDTWEEDFLDWFNLSAMPTGGLMHPGLDLVIVGGESGPGARPMHPAWTRQIRDDCAAAQVPFFFKQWGEFAPAHDEDGIDAEFAVAVNGAIDREKPFRLPNIGGAQPRWAPMARVGKSAAGRILDGQVHSQFPEPRS